MNASLTASAPGTMKISAAVLAVILTAATLCAPTSASPHGSDTTPCCFGYLSLALPRVHVKEYFYTSSKCSNFAVVFVTRRNRQVCANPKKKWVQEYINYLEMK
ncbi:C-C motif chemokine 5 [Phodopus roborovskii]|nr:C-C motif chemokine 5 [Phodopus roborovskii]